MKRVISCVLLSVIWLNTRAVAISIAASQALDYIRGEYFYEIPEPEMNKMQSICNEYVNEDAIQKIVEMLDEYSCYYTAEYCKNIAPGNYGPDIQHVNAAGCVYIKINTFAENTGKAFIEIWESVKETDIVYVDLRSCEGGYIASMIDVASCLLGKGLVCTAIYKNSTYTYEASEDLTKVKPENLFLLVSEKTASAAEILAGAAKARLAGTILGSSATFGKTSIQQIVQLKSGGILKFTVGKYHICGGDDITKKGVAPDSLIKKAIE